MPVTFSYADRKLNYSSKRSLKTFLVHLAGEEGFSIGELNYVFCSDEFLLNINQTFLQHDYFTDIITFDLGDGSGQVICGEVYVSVDRVKDNAGAFKEGFDRELCRVVFHGLLHLCGYRDKTKKEIADMRAAEVKYLNAFFGI